jgi:hypothetical protein
MKHIARAILILSLVALAAPATAQTLNCADEAKTQSTATGAPMTLNFRNDGQTAATLFWIDQQRQRKQYAVIQPGASLFQQTFEGHVWLLARPDGSCVAMFGAMTVFPDKSFNLDVVPR